MWCRGCKTDTQGEFPSVTWCPLICLTSAFGRFFTDKRITSFAESILKEYGKPNEGAILFPSHAVAARCAAFFRSQLESEELGSHLRLLDLYPYLKLSAAGCSGKEANISPMVSAVIYPLKHSPIAKSFWQHTGDGISSRRAELCHKAFDDGFLEAKCTSKKASAATKVSIVQRPCKGPRRYQREAEGEATGSGLGTVDGHTTSPSSGRLDGDEYKQFVEERYGRNLDFTLAGKAKLALRRRIAGALTADVDLQQPFESFQPVEQIRSVKGLSEDDVYLYPTGMSSIFNAHRTMLEYRGALKSICFGYVLA